MKIENLSVIYGNRLILDDITIEFVKGKVSTIKGISGSGKSSLLNVLGLMQKGHGNYIYNYNDSDITKLTETEQADFRLHHIGFIFQANNLLPEFTVYENVLLPTMVCFDGKDCFERIDELLDYVGLAHMKEKYPYTLSGGEEQRVAIARALANDADIILADEPTASLDDANAHLILDLLQQLAHELGKTVIIVSHDTKVADISDVVYQIDKHKVKLLKGDTEKQRSNVSSEETTATPKRNIISFVHFYLKNRMGDRLLNKVFVALTAAVTAFAMLFANFGSEFTEGQTLFMNSISDKSIFIVNDTMGFNSDVIYDGAIGMSNEMLNKINEIPYISTWYPYYEFLSVGTSTEDFANANNKFDITKDAKVIIKEHNQILVEKEYENGLRTDPSAEQFSVVPLYPEENMSFLLEYKSENEGLDGIIITRKLAEKLSESLGEVHALIDKEIEITAFVPAKLYSSKATKPQSGGINSVSDMEISIDGVLSKLVTIKGKISGVLSADYRQQRGNITDNFLLPYHLFNDILIENQDQHYGETYVGFPEKPLAPSAIVAFANAYDAVPTIVTKLEAIAPTFSITHKASDIKTIQSNIYATKNIMMIITTIFLGIIMIMFSMLYYIKNRSRKKEVGILKALGLKQSNIFNLIMFEMFGIGLKSFAISLLIAFVGALLANSLYSAFSIKLFSITFSSIVLGFVISIAIVLVAGVFPIYQASKVDAVEAIRQIGK